MSQARGVPGKIPGQVSSRPDPRAALLRPEGRSAAPGSPEPPASQPPSYPRVVARQEGLLEPAEHRQQDQETQALVSEQLKRRQQSGPERGRPLLAVTFRPSIFYGFQKHGCEQDRQEAAP